MPREEPRTCPKWYMRSKRVTVSYVLCPSDHTIREICVPKTRSSLGYTVVFDVCLIMIENCAIRKQIRKHVRNGPGCASVHYSDVIMSAMASQITGVPIVYSAVCLGADTSKIRGTGSHAQSCKMYDEKYAKLCKCMLYGMWLCIHLLLV